MKKTYYDTKILKRPAASFSRAGRITFGDVDIILISGTASVNAERQSVHADNFSRQVYKAYENIEALLGESGATFKDIVNMTVFLKDIGQYYDEFNRIRDAFFKRKGIYKSPPTSTCVEAKLCRPELLVEMNAIAIKQRAR